MMLLQTRVLFRGSRYHYNKDYYQFARKLINKRLHFYEQNEEKESKKYRDENEDQARPNTSTKEEDQTEQDSAMSIEEIELELKKVRRRCVKTGM